MTIASNPFRRLETSKPGVTARTVRRALLPLVTLSLCSCATFDRRVESIPHEQSTAPVVRSQTAAEPDGRVTLSAPQRDSIQQTNYAQAIDSPPGNAVCPPGALLGTYPMFPGPVLPPGNPVHLYPDEYLFDGGDRAKPVHYDEFHRHGLDTEDTVAEYTDHLGKRRVKPTNRVAVYAPRFGAVMTVSQPADGTNSRQLNGVQEEVHLAGVRSRLRTGNHKGRNVPDGIRVRVRGSGVDADRKDVTFKGRTVVALNAGNRKPMENLTLIRAGVFDRTQEAALAMGIQAAAAWTKRQFPVIVGARRDATEVSAKAEGHVMIGQDDSHKKKGELRIIKIADKATAKPGEIVTFTIRYDNIGDRELHHIRILDNLSPRLEYVDDSADSDRKGKLVVEDNQAGSLVLKFELAEPLKGRTGGVVKFKARVR